ncbi:MAG: hypothetical protein RM022_017065 [Nostoc sp. EfeVER01]|uniref:hypothetical protein n=1 Tax=unclassified Nostoc TaxID=2593658 RepID=UPI002AD1FD7D|nr:MULTISPECIES: hypothetical protein [unclassified Nostoc]MDZ7944985.1 hypothetical protein [Nostoc sp. EfeVER01]MDZ7992634.1 hypothetical protein [Nostoc sp. EspVER01]
MNYSVEYIAHKINECLALIDKHQREIFRLRRVIADLKCQPVTNDEGEVISYNDFES